VPTHVFADDALTPRSNVFLLVFLQKKKLLILCLKKNTQKEFYVFAAWPVESAAFCQPVGRPAPQPQLCCLKA
jgi:hypothetical protein